MRYVYLTSSPTGPLDGSRPIYGLDPMNHFVSNLHKHWKENSRVLIITANPYSYQSNDEMCDFFRNAFLVSGFTLSTFDLMDARYIFSKKDVETYDVVILGGGHVPTQLRYFREIDLRYMLKDFDGIVIGISAGSMNSAETVYIQPEIDGESPESFVRFGTGLGLIDVQIIPHYQQVKDNYVDGRRLFEDLTYADSYGQYFLCLEDGSYVLKDEEGTHVYGKSYVIHNGSTEFFTSMKRKWEYESN